MVQNLRRDTEETTDRMEGVYIGKKKKTNELKDIEDYLIVIKERGSEVIKLSKEAIYLWGKTETRTGKPDTKKEEKKTQAEKKATQKDEIEEDRERTNSSKSQQEDLQKKYLESSHQ